MGIPGGFCGITPPGTRTVNRGPTVRRPPTFYSFSHQQPAVMAVTKWSIPALGVSVDLAPAILSVARMVIAEVSEAPDRFVFHRGFRFARRFARKGGEIALALRRMR